MTQREKQKQRARKELAAARFREEQATGDTPTTSVKLKSLVLPADTLANTRIMCVSRVSTQKQADNGDLNDQENFLHYHADMGKATTVFTLKLIGPGCHISQRAKILFSQGYKHGAIARIISYETGERITRVTVRKWALEQPGAPLKAG